MITRGGTPVARLVPVAPKTATRRLGMDRSKVHVAEDVDAPLPEALLASFEGG